MSHVYLNRGSPGRGRRHADESEVDFPMVGGVAHQPLGVTVAQVLHLQRTAGNRAVTSLLQAGAVPVQRKPSLSGLKKAVGLGSKGPKETPAQMAERMGTEAGATKILNAKDLEKQIAILESALKKIMMNYQPGGGADAANAAASRVRQGAQRILKNAQKSGGTPNQLRRLRVIIGEADIFMDHTRVAATNRAAQDIYLESGRKAKGAGGFEHLGTKSAFKAKMGDAPAAGTVVDKKMQDKGFTDYEQLYDEAIADPSNLKPLSDLAGNNTGLMQYMNIKRARAVAPRLGLTDAELAAIQTFTGNDYEYINPATSNNPAWMGDFQGRVTGATEDERRQESKAIQAEGSTHTAVAMQGLMKLPVWKGTAYRGQGLDRTRFFRQFAKEGENFRLREPLSFSTLTSISKEERAAKEFMSSGANPYASIMWVMEVTNGRDIVELSVNRHENEIALLPGATFVVTSIEVVQKAYIDVSMDNPFDSNWKLRVHCKQVA
jgi:hypothetical protein